MCTVMKFLGEQNCESSFAHGKPKVTVGRDACHLELMDYSRQSILYQIYVDTFLSNSLIWIFNIWIFNMNFVPVVYLAV